MKLIEAAEYAAELLGKIPAFGDSLGAEVNKPLLGVARNRLIEALAEIHVQEPHP